jgi:hypothetical protein
MNWLTRANRGEYVAEGEMRRYPESSKDRAVRLLRALLPDADEDAVYDVVSAVLDAVAEEAARRANDDY